MNKRLLIGVVTAECHIDFQSETLKGIVSQAFKSNCDIAVISSFHNFFAESRHKNCEKEIFRMILSDRFDGFLYDRNTFYGEKIRGFIDELLEKSGKPVMLLDSGDHRKFESTAIDDCSAFEEITDHLIEVHGFRKIYCLTGPKKQFVSEERLNGFRLSMKKHGVPIGRESCIYGDFWVNAARELAADIIAGRIPRPEAVICGNDHSAISLTAALTEGGIRVPEDIAVTGYDDSAEGRSFSPSITSFRRPNFQLGAEAFRRLYRIITGRICIRVGSENVSLRLGESCGCGCPPSETKKESRRSVMKSRYMADILHGDMLFDISAAETPEKFADRLDNYTYCLYKMRRIFVCLTKDFLEGSDELAFDVNSVMKPILRKTFLRREYDGCGYFKASELLPIFTEERSRPVAYFITALHCNDRFFGYSAVSFGKESIAFDEPYCHWTSFVNSALDRLRLTCTMEREVSSAYKLAYCDGRTGLPNRCGIERQVAEKFSRTGQLSFIRIQVSGIEKLYYSGGDSEVFRVTDEFAGLIRQCVREGELFGLWDSGVFAVVTDRQNREKELFTELSASVGKSALKCGEGCDAAFNVGVHTQIWDGVPDSGLAMQRAAINKVYGYTGGGAGSDPQFERLCRLRERIAENPELPWNIGEIANELFLSKSYLQKIYKTHFGKGIIEEMIAFRMDKARSLLAKTDLTVTEIARVCGYSTYNYFVRQFKSHVGVSPNDYRSRKEIIASMPEIIRDAFDF